ncbi:MAG: fibronectin type III domain-containing protein [Chlorobi bacterium CHB1]|nr:fibronectin type III domain-containing protein [Chlorobi bacterium CHB1]
MFVQEFEPPFRIFFYDHMQTIATGIDTTMFLDEAGDEIGTTNFRNHLHFCEGPNQMEVHPLRDSESLCSFSDTTRPKITNFRVHKDGQYGYDVQMPKDDDGVYNVTGRVDFLVKANDIISGPGGSNTGLFGVEYEIYDSTPTKLAGNKIYFDTTWVHNQYLQFTYDTILSNSSTYWYIPTNKLISNGYWDSQTVADGVYNLCYWAADVRFNYRDTCYTIKVANHPTTPVIQGAIEGEEQVELTFGGAGATSYRIYYDTDTGPPYQGAGADQGASPIEISVDSTVTKTVTLTGLTNGQTYYFAVKGYNSNTDEESNYSVEVSATPNIFPPPTPENFAASLNSGGFVQLSWEENDSSTAEAAGFIIFRSQTSGSGFSVLPKSAQGYL